VIDAVTTHAVEHQEHAQVHLATRSMDLGVTSRQATTAGKSTISTIITTALRVDLSYYSGIAKRLQDKGLKVIVVEATLSRAIKP
jgi:hypothetical protein